MEHVAAKIIAVATLIITVAGCIWFGLKAARREQQYPQKIEYLEDGFVYHDAFGDTIVRWQDITATEAKREKRGYGAKYYGEVKEHWVLDIFTGSKLLSILDDDFAAVSFDQFINTLQQKVYTANPQFRGISGDIHEFRTAITLPERQSVTQEKMRQDMFNRILQSKIAALGHPPDNKEALRLIEETEREIEGQYSTHNV